MLRARTGRWGGPDEVFAPGTYAREEREKFGPRSPVGTTLTMPSDRRRRISRDPTADWVVHDNWLVPAYCTKPTQERVLTVKYFEDLELGTVIEHPGRALSAKEVIEFGKQFDSEPFHVDPVAARDTIFGGLVAGGAHTFALWRRLSWEMLGEYGWATLAGAGFDEMRLARPLKPGDWVRLRTELLEETESRSKPDRGIIKTRQTLSNQDGEVVMSLICTAITRDARTRSGVSRRRHEG